MFTQIRRVLPACLFLIVAHAAISASTTELRVGVFQNPPKIQVDESGHPAGMLVDILNRIAGREDWTLRYIPCRWQDCLASLRDGQLDLLPDVAYTEERARQFDFPQVPVLYNWSELYRRQREPVKSVQDLAGKRIAIMRGSVQMEGLQSLLSAYRVQVAWVPVDSVQNAFEAVATRKADVAVATNYFGDMAGLEYGLISTSILFQPIRLFYAAPKGRHQDVLAALDRHLAVWQANPDSEYYDILRKWRPQSGLQGVPRMLKWGAAMAMALLLTSLGTAIFLRRKVNAQTRDLRQSERKLATILDTVDSPIYIKDAAYRYTYVNRATCERLGKPAEQILGRSDDELFSPGTAAALRARDRLVIEQGQRVVAEEFHEDPRQVGGHTFLSTKIPLKGVDERVFALCGISTDITDRKRTEESLRIAATVFQSQEGMFITGPDMRLLDINRAYAQMTGFQAEELLGKPHPAVWFENAREDCWPSIWAEVRRHGKWQGEVWARRKDGEKFPAWLTLTAVRDQEDRITHYVGTQTDNTQRRLAQEQITRLAYYDSLTGLPNRRLLMDRLRHSLAAHRRSAHAGALLFIDLDNFKDLNDTRGHEAGDNLLQQVARRILGCCRESDTVARLGGDEFVVLMEDVGASGTLARAHTRMVAQKILAAVSAPYVVDGAMHRCSCSIGAEVCTAPDISMEDLMKRGDLAMYEAKRAGRNTVRFFHEGMERAVNRRTVLEAEIREGLDQGRFQLHFQPQFDIEGRIIGAEALVRWKQEGRGLVSPAEFIGVAESTGLILPLGHWVLATACRQLAEWSASALPRIPLAVNVSARQLRQADFVERTLVLLEEAGVAPSLLKIELTESTLVEDVGDAIAKMRRLKERGVSFALDDFGTGYSSLSYLKQLPLDQLKIDRSFVRDVLTDSNDAAIATSIVAMGKALGLGLIAEGVEMPEQRDFLAALGCGSFQGYLYARPVDEAAFRELLNNGSAVQAIA